MTAAASRSYSRYLGVPMRRRPRLHDWLDDLPARLNGLDWTKLLPHVADPLVRADIQEQVSRRLYRDACATGKVDGMPIEQIHARAPLFKKVLTHARALKGALDESPFLAFDLFEKDHHAEQREEALSDLIEELDGVADAAQRRLAAARHLGWPASHGPKLRGSVKLLGHDLIAIWEKSGGKIGGSEKAPGPGFVAALVSVVYEPGLNLGQARRMFREYNKKRAGRLRRL
jgi:hypothetical protein